ncbi:E3 ubiquitin-protein ligase listerin [Orussus abietinus]|uniref:E3 ubiquitin-protein ligase listerin n=1 Tax=Orussus abietinus TaxID=222816 RepID=UPI000625C070|nr:E3 ubiquitin-protein ligase listerin [Orussus abietinus]XP_012276739.1 E3 ubiquitin-protein ligase listerin [Orussus abietinus]
MGKNKQAQRTKSNARPSSSSRSAELLGATVPGFIGFSADKSGGYIPILPGLEINNGNNVDANNVGSNFQLVLKKINKKDVTTKTKALQEFAELCKNVSLVEIEAVLPFWPRIYCRLVLDIEHRVREGVHIAHTALVRRVGKGIAIYLKQLAGPWFTSQFDTYPPAASAAANSLNETFPPNKIINAMVHCQEEILSYICDNITMETPQSLLLNINTSSEGMDARYHRLLIASLQGYCLYLTKVPLHQVEKTLNIQEKITSNNKFWKLAKHEVLLIETAFFNVLTLIIDRANKLIKHQKKKTMTSIINSLDETDPILLAAVWECLLVAISKIEDWYEFVHIDKFVLPKLWQVLRSGGQCCASIVYPNLLPFVSQFPKFNTDLNSLYTNFFNNMRQGFSVKSVQLSQSEMQAVTTSFIECLRYAVLLNSSDIFLCKILLKEQLIPVLESCIKECSLIKSILFGQVTNLVRYWSKNRTNTDYPSYVHLIKEFWTELDILFDKLNDEDNERARHSQINLLLNLRNVSNKNRENLRVTFSDAITEPVIHNDIKSAKSTEDTVFLKELDQFVFAIGVRCFNKIIKDRSSPDIEYFNSIVTNFKNKDLFNPISDVFIVNQEKFKVWLTENSEQTDMLLRLAFALSKYMDTQNREKLLEWLLKLDDPRILKSVVYCAVSENNRDEETVKKWCLQTEVTSALINITKELITDVNGDENRNILSLAFQSTNDGGPLISETAINDITSLLCHALNDTEQRNFSTLCKFASHVLSLVWSYETPSVAAIQMLETLFELSIQQSFNDTSLAHIVQSSWKDGLVQMRRKFSQAKFLEITSKLAETLWEDILERQDFRLTDKWIEGATDFLEVVITNEDGYSMDFVKDVLPIFLIESNVKPWLTDISTIVLHGEVISGNLYASQLQQRVPVCNGLVPVDTKDSINDHMVNCLRWAMLSARLMNELFGRTEKDTLNQNNGQWEVNVDTEFQLICLPTVTEILKNVIYVAVLGQIYESHYQSTKHYINTSALLISLKGELENLKKLYIPKSVYTDTVCKFEESSSLSSSMWAYMLRFCCTELGSNNDPTVYLENYKKIFSDGNSTLESYLQTIQILSMYLDLGKISLNMEDELDTLIVGRSVLTAQDDESILLNILNSLINRYYADPTFLLLDQDMHDVSWEQVTLPLEVVRLLTKFVATIPDKLSSVHWDCVLICLASWQLSINKSKSYYDDIKVKALTIAVSQLFCAVQGVMKKYEAEPSVDLPPDLFDEWKNVFSRDIQFGIVSTWMTYAEMSDHEDILVTSVIPLDYLGEAVRLVDEKLFFEKETGNNLMGVTPDEVVNFSTALIKSTVPSIQLGAYYLLKSALPELVERDKSIIEVETFDPDSLNIQKFERVVSGMGQIVNTMLMDFKLCDAISCTIQPYTDSYTYTLGYLLSWAIVLEMCAHAHADLRYQYAEVLKNNVFTSLLNNIFRMMPVEVLQDNKNKSSILMKYFGTTPSLALKESWTEERLDHMVCWLYANSLRYLPVLVRQWWSTTDSRVSAAVDKITILYVSPVLCQEELQNNRLTDIENMQVKIHPTAREVVAVYQMEDTKLELSMTLPINHPLGPITVEPGQFAGGAANWRNCHMQLSIFLTHQNGSIWDGLLLWKKNLDKKFAGVEECYICFSIFHSVTYHIPKLSCRTCRKRFHTPCLYKWFSTSQKSTCPICRNVF